MKGLKVEEILRKRESRRSQHSYFTYMQLLIIRASQALESMVSKLLDIFEYTMIAL